MDEDELRQAFEARDVDGDGLLSVQDLRHSTNLSEGELAAVFEACQGPGTCREFLTFEDFAAGFRRFPQPTKAPSPKPKKLQIFIDSIDESTEETPRETNCMVECWKDFREELTGELEATRPDITPAEVFQSVASLLTEKLTEKEISAAQKVRIARLFSTASEVVSAQRQEIAKLQQLLEEESNWNEAISREHEALKRTCKLLTEKTREFEMEWMHSSASSETQTAKLRQELEALRSEQQLNAQRLEDFHSLLQDKETQIAELKAQLRKREIESSLQRFNSREATSEAAPSPQVIKTSRAALRFIFSPRNPSPDRSAFQESLRKRQMTLVTAREKELEAREETLRMREIQLEAAVTRKCETLRAENEQLRTQLLRERIKCENYKVLAKESPRAMDGCVGNLHEEMEKLREKSPIRVRIIPQNPPKSKRSCWFFL